jgi:hypothetical protein
LNQEDEHWKSRDAEQHTTPDRSGAVIWAGQEIRLYWIEDVSPLAGKPILLCFHLRSADLYSFAFRI